MSDTNHQVAFNSVPSRDGCPDGDAVIRVLHVVGNMDFGGVETLLMALYRSVDRAVVQFDFLCHNETPGKYDAEITALGGHIYRVPGIGMSSVLSYQRALRAFFESPAGAQYRIVHSHLNKLNGFVLHAASRAGVPYRIAHAHEGVSNYGLLRNVLRTYASFLNGRHATHGLACSIEAAQHGHMGTLRATTQILNNGIDTRHFTFCEDDRERARTSLHLKDSFVIGHVGRFEAQKNHEFLVDVFARFVRLNPHAQMILVGVGSREGAVRRLIAERGLSGSVQLLGARTDVKELMAAMDVFLFPSRWEGLGIAAIEAQSMGLWTMASEAVPRDAKLTDRISFVGLGDPDAWVQRLVGLSSSCVDTNRAAYAQQVAGQGYEISRVADQLQTLYQSLDGANGGSFHSALDDE